MYLQTKGQELVLGLGTKKAILGGTINAVNNLTIRNARITARAKFVRAGIGTSFGDIGISFIKHLVIDRSVANASGSWGSAGVGPSRGWWGISRMTELEISNSIAVAVGDHGGPGIGAGWGDLGISEIDSIRFANANASARAKGRPQGSAPAGPHRAVECSAN
jgi:hypothetical protein